MKIPCSIQRPAAELYYFKKGLPLDKCNNKYIKSEFDHNMPDSPQEMLEQSI